MMESMVEASLGSKTPCLMRGRDKVLDYVVNKKDLDSYPTLEIFTRHC